LYFVSEVYQELRCLWVLYYHGKEKVVGVFVPFRAPSQREESYIIDIVTWYIFVGGHSSWFFVDSLSCLLVCAGFVFIVCKLFWNYLKLLFHHVPLGPSQNAFRTSLFLCCLRFFVHVQVTIRSPRAFWKKTRVNHTANTNLMVLRFLRIGLAYWNMFGLLKKFWISLRFYLDISISTMILVWRSSRKKAFLSNNKDVCILTDRTQTSCLLFFATIWLRRCTGTKLRYL
jgi:hypothetical protein